MVIIPAKEYSAYMCNKDIKTLPVFPNRELTGEFAKIPARVHINWLQPGQFYRPYGNDVCEVISVNADSARQSVSVRCFFQVGNNPDLGIMVRFVHNWDESIHIYRRVFHDGHRNREGW
jgi:hypothetical protein